MVIALQTGAEVSFWVPGTAQTAGSKSRVPIIQGGEVISHRIVESGDRSAKAEWRADLRIAAQRAVEMDEGEWPYDGPLLVEMKFARKRPGGHFGTGRNAGVLKERALAERPWNRPDALKLARAAEDALTGVLWTDDARIVEGRYSKWYPDQLGRGRYEIGVEVHAWQL